MNRSTLKRKTGGDLSEVIFQVSRQLQVFTENGKRANRQLAAFRRLYFRTIFLTVWHGFDMLRWISSSMAFGTYPPKISGLPFKATHQGFQRAKERLIKMAEASDAITFTSIR